MRGAAPHRAGGPADRASGRRLRRGRRSRRPLPEEALIEDTDLRAVGSLQDEPLDQEGAIRTIGPTIPEDGAPGDPGPLARPIGCDTRAVLGEAGYRARGIDTLISLPVRHGSLLPPCCSRRAGRWCPAVIPPAHYGSTRPPCHYGGVAPSHNRQATPSGQNRTADPQSCSPPCPPPARRCVPGNLCVLSPCHGLLG